MNRESLIKALELVLRERGATGDLEAKLREHNFAFKLMYDKFSTWSCVDGQAPNTTFFIGEVTTTPSGAIEAVVMVHGQGSTTRAAKVRWEP